MYFKFKNLISYLFIFTEISSR